MQSDIWHRMEAFIHSKLQLALLLCMFFPLHFSFHLTFYQYILGTAPSEFFKNIFLDSCGLYFVIFEIRQERRLEERGKTFSKSQLGLKPATAGVWVMCPNSTPQLHPAPHNITGQNFLGLWFLRNHRLSICFHSAVPMVIWAII